MNDLIKRSDVLRELLDGHDDIIYIDRNAAIKRIKSIPAIEPKQEWIPVKWHKITEEERAEEDYPLEWEYIIDSSLPEDGEDILVTTKGGRVAFDTNYDDDGVYLDSGWDWADDIAAWMPLPPAYEEGADDETD